MAAGLPEPVVTHGWEGPALLVQVADHPSCMTQNKMLAGGLQQGVRLQGEQQGVNGCF